MDKSTSGANVVGCRRGANVCGGKWSNAQKISYAPARLSRITFSFTANNQLVRSSFSLLKRLVTLLYLSCHVSSLSTAVLERSSGGYIKSCSRFKGFILLLVFVSVSGIVF